MSSSLLANLVIFARLLRQLGIAIGTTQVCDLPAALSEIDISKRQQVKDAARCLLITRREDLALFDQAFDWFWQKRDFDDDARRAAQAFRPQFVNSPRPPSAFLT